MRYAAIINRIATAATNPVVQWSMVVLVQVKDADLPPTTDPPMTPKWDGGGGGDLVAEGVAVLEVADDELVVDRVAGG